MVRSFFRLALLFLVMGAMASAVGSAAPAQPATASMTSRLLTSAVLVEGTDRRPDRLQLQARPTTTPTAAPTVVPTPAPIAPRPPATLRPIPVPVVDAQEVALLNLDTGRILWQRNARAAWAPASLTKIFTPW